VSAPAMDLSDEAATMERRLQDETATEEEEEDQTEEEEEEETGEEETETGEEETGTEEEEASETEGESEGDTEGGSDSENEEVELTLVADKDANDGCSEEAQKQLEQRLSKEFDVQAKMKGCTAGSVTYRIGLGVTAGSGKTNKDVEAAVLEKDEAFFAELVGANVEVVQVTKADGSTARTYDEQFPFALSLSREAAIGTLVGVVGFVLLALAGGLYLCCRKKKKGGGKGKGKGGDTEA